MLFHFAYKTNAFSIFYTKIVSFPSYNQCFLNIMYQDWFILFHFVSFCLQNHSFFNILHQDCFILLIKPMFFQYSVQILLHFVLFC